MKIVLAGAVAALALTGAIATTAPADARVSFGVSLNEGDVQFAYRDGYWDRYHRWHVWADRDDWRWYRIHHRDRYYDWAHDRDRDMGWREGGYMGGPGPGVVVGVPGFEVGIGDIAYAYNDGYWDRWHRWHVWHNDGERVWWRDHHPGAYWDWRHDRDRGMGWRRDWRDRH